MSVFLSRIAPGSTVFNTINERSVDVFFQRSPQFPSADKSGIKSLEFQVLDTSNTVIQKGKTGDDGKITVRIRGGGATLQLMHAGAAVASYSIRINDNDFEARNTIRGVQRRLRLLGYHLGHAGTGADGIDGVIGPRTEAALTHFQVDNDLVIDAIFGGASQTKLNTVTGGTAGNT